MAPSEPATVDIRFRFATAYPMIGPIKALANIGISTTLLPARGKMTSVMSPTTRGMAAAAIT